MPNVIDVTDDFKSGCKDRSRLHEHELKIMNVTQDKDITELIDPGSFKDNSEREGLFGLISANQVDFTIELNPEDNISDYINKDDKFEFINEFNDESPVIFTGYAREPSAAYENLEHTFDITIKDRIKSGMDKKFEDHVVHVGWYLCNIEETDQSLVHDLANRMGFSEDDLELETVTDMNDDPLVIPYAHFEKDNRIADELSELAKSVNGTVFVNHEDKLVFMTPYNESQFTDIGFTFDDNVKRPAIDVNTVEAEHDGVEVTYDYFNQANRQVCWFYHEKDSYDEENDEANMLLPAGESSTWIKIEWETPIAINIESDDPEVRVEDPSGNDASDDFSYEIDVDMTGGKVRFHNFSDDEDIYIQEFKIYGEPLEKVAGNELSYTEADQPEKMYPLENKYIQTEEHAEAAAKLYFHAKCKDRKQYSFPCYYTPFLQINNLVQINKRDIDKTCEVARFQHKGRDNYLNTEVELVEHLELGEFDGVVDKIESPNIEDDSGRFTEPKNVENLELEEIGETGKDGAYTPIIAVTWDRPDDPFYREACVYYKKSSDSEWEFHNKTRQESAAIRLSSYGEYDVRVVSESKNGVRADTALSPSDSIEITGKDSPPSPVEFREEDIEWKADAIILKWHDHPDPDFDEYEVRLDNNFGE